MKTNKLTERPEYLPLLRHAYSPKIRVYAAEPVGPGAKQSFKDECDINQILAKYQKTGAIAHMNRHEPNYGFCSSSDFQESLNQVREAEEMFADLPSSLRKKFGNDPANYLDFVQNPENIEEMRELGLAKQSAKPERVKTDAPEEGGGKDPQSSKHGFQRKGGDRGAAALARSRLASLWGKNRNNTTPKKNNPLKDAEGDSGGVGTAYAILVPYAIGDNNHLYNYNKSVPIR